mmetsp:Transcript_24108/g.55676  ORF Transcript_24108/g.55676 Transcript_24108/m.55676 type:complete len:169 (+) Transcript_24108:67-573(+)
MADESDPKEYTIRPLQKEDFDKGYVQVLAQLTTVAGLTQEVFMQVLDHREQSGLYCTVVAEHNASGTIAGTATLLFERKFIHGGGLVGHVEDVVVDSAHRRKGLAGLMMRELERAAKSRPGCYKIILDCKESNAVVYEKCNYRKCEIQMRLDLMPPSSPCLPDLQPRE